MKYIVSTLNIENRRQMKVVVEWGIYDDVDGLQL